MSKIELSTGAVVEMREPKLKDVRLLSNIKDEEEKTINLIANLTMLSEDELNDLSMKDYGLLQKELEGFLV
jgi:hypothetical protein